MLRLQDVDISSEIGFFVHPTHVIDRDDAQDVDMYCHGCELKITEKAITSSNGRVFADLLYGKLPDGLALILSYGATEKAADRLAHACAEAFRTLESESISKRTLDKVRNFFVRNIQFCPVARVAEAMTKYRAFCAAHTGDEAQTILERIGDDFMSSFFYQGLCSGFTATFIAPNSISTAAKTDHALITAHQKAVDQVVTQLARRTIGIYVGGMEDVVPNNLVCAKVLQGFRDRDCSLLASRCIIVNGHRTADGRWFALGTLKLAEKARLLDLIYLNALAEKVQKLGYEIRPNTKGFELTGNTARPEFLWGQPIDVDGVIEDLAERSAVNDSLSMEVAALERNLGRASCEAIAGSIFSQPGLVSLVAECGSGGKLTCLGQIRAEEEVLSLAHSGRDKFLPIADAGVASAIADRLGYTRGRRNALLLSVTTRDQFHLWCGVAGSGKTSTLRDFVALCTCRGIGVACLATDARAAHILATDVGAEARTVDAFLLDDPNPEIALLVVDEASKLSTAKAAALMKKAALCNCRVLFVGDICQFSATSAGNPFRALYEDEATGKAELTEHLRQNDIRLKTAVDLAALGQERALKMSVHLLQRNITAARCRETRINKVIHKFTRLLPEQRDRTLIIADRSSDCRTLTERIRVVLKREGRIGIQESTFTTLRPRNFTRATLRHTRYYSVGDIVVLDRDAERLHKDVPYPIIDIRDGHVILCSEHNNEVAVEPRTLEHHAIYVKDTLDLAVGDRVCWRRSSAEHCSKATFEVVSVQAGLAMLRSGTERYPITNSAWHHLDYAWVQSTYDCQGQTKDFVIALLDKRTCRESWYVALSRARERVDIITDSFPNLLNRVLRLSTQRNALDFVVGAGFR